MEVTSTLTEEPTAKLNVDIDDIVAKDVPVEAIENEKVVVEEATNNNNNKSIDYDDDEDSGDDIAVITKTSAVVESSPAKNLFSIKTISNVPPHSNYKISKTAIDLEHPGNVNGVATVDYDLSKVTDDCKPWKKPGADVSDFFNYGFTEETWLHYCDKQRALRMTPDNSAIKTLNSLSNFGCNLSGSHIHMGFNRNNPKNTKGGLIDVIGCQQNADFKGGKTGGGGDGQGLMGSKISSIPVQTGHMGMGQHQAGSYMAGLASQALSNNLLNPIMSAIAMGMLPNPGNVPLLGNQHQHNQQQIETKISQYGDGGPQSIRNFGNWNGGNNQDFARQASVESGHDKKAARRDDHRPRDKTEKSSEKRRRSRSRSRDRGHDSKHSRSSKRNRSPEDSRRHKKHSRDRSKDRASSEDSSKRHRRHKSPKKRRHSRSRSHEDRRHRHKSQEGDQGRSRHDKEDPAAAKVDAVKREKEAPSAD